MFESMTPVEMIVCVALFLGGLAFSKIQDVVAERKAERVFHERHQDRKIHEHDLMLKMGNGGK